MYPFDLPDQPATLLRRQSHQIIAARKADNKSELISTIKGISLAKLVEKIVTHGENDKETFSIPTSKSKRVFKPGSFRRASTIIIPVNQYKEMQACFLSCYRNLCTPLELAKLLKLRYTGPDINATKHQISYFAANKGTIRPRAMDFFSDFVDSLHGSDFIGEDAEELFEAITHFSTDYDCLTQAQLQNLMELRQKGHALAEPAKRLSVISYKSSEAEVQPQLSVDDIVHEIIAQEFVIFSNVHPSEFLSLAWSTKHKLTKAPTIARLIEIFNWVTTWISTRILMCTTPEARSSLIEFFISVGMRMKQLNNLNGVMEIQSALNSTPIARLHRSWALISKESMDDFAQLTELMDCFQNFKAYRQFLAQIDPNVPCLPYIGLLLTDITFICEGNSGYVEPNLINVHYVKLLGGALADIARYQRNRYQLPTPASSIYMEVAYNSDDLYQLSKLREDKKQLAEIRGGKVVRRQMPKQAGRRTLSNTDFVPRVPPPTSEDRHILTANGKAINFKAGEVIFNAEHRNDYLYYVASGKVSLEITTGIHSEVVAEIGRHKFFGLVSFFDGGSAWHSAVAAEPCTILEIQRQLVNQVLAYDVDFASRIYKCFANIISDLIRRAQALLSRIRKLERSAAEDDKSDTSSNHTLSLPQTPTSPPTSPMFRGVLSPTSSYSPLQERPTNDLSSSQEKPSGRIFNISQVALKVYECKYKVFSGSLYVFPSYICFYAKVFGFAKKIVLYCTNITDVIADPGTSFTVQETSSKKYKFQLASEEVQKEAVGFSKTIMNKKNVTPSSPGAGTNQFTELQQPPENQSVSSVLTESEWMLLLNGAQNGTFPPGHVFINEASRPSGFFQIIKGACGIQVEVDGKTVNVAKRKVGELFGEMSFLDESAVASASVVAITEVEAYSLNESFANVLLNAHSGIAPKFYHYIGLVLVARLRELDTSRR